MSPAGNQGNGGRNRMTDHERMSDRLVDIVVTPGSGEGRALGLARRLRRLLRRRRCRVTIRAFDDLAGLVRWAESGACESSHVVCVGGDATVSAAARAAIRCNAPLLPVPTGFGN